MNKDSATLVAEIFMHRAVRIIHTYWYCDKEESEVSCESKKNIIIGLVTDVCIICGNCYT